MWNLDWNSVKFLYKEQRNSYLNSALSSLRLEQLTTKILNQNSSSHKGVGLWAKSINRFGNFGRHFPCATSAKILAGMYARVPQAMAQFVLKIEKLSHIMAPTPILEMARAYGLHPRLWLLVMNISGAEFEKHCFNISKDILYSIFYYFSCTPK